MLTQGRVDMKPQLPARAIDTHARAQNLRAMRCACMQSRQVQAWCGVTTSATASFDQACKALPCCGASLAHQRQRGPV